MFAFLRGRNFPMSLMRIGELRSNVAKRKLFREFIEPHNHVQQQFAFLKIDKSSTSRDTHSDFSVQYLYITTHGKISILKKATQLFFISYSSTF